MTHYEQAVITGFALALDLPVAQHKEAVRSAMRACQYDSEIAHVAGLRLWNDSLIAAWPRDEGGEA